MLKGRVILVLAVVVTTLCVAGMVQMFVLRYTTGDAYPAFSSLRADPKGCKVLCESLGRLPGVSVTRNRRDFSEWTGTETGKTIVLAGYSLWSFKYEDPADVQQIYDLASAGNRVVVALASTTMRKPDEEDEETVEKAKEALDKHRELKGKKQKEEDSGRTEHHWSVEIQLSPLPENAKDRYALFVPSPEADGVRIPWNSSAAFTHPGETWSIVGHRDQMPTILECEVGNGSLVLCADSYFLSNEAQLKERSTPFLVWLLGPHREIIFDETHLGISAQSGVASLIRQYRLHGLVGSLILLAGLFVWKNLFSLVPRREEDRAETEVEGKDQTEGLVNLLRHHVPTKKLMTECERTWRNSIRFLPHLGPARQEEVRTALAQNADERPETTYQRIQQILKQRN